jgi:hypothetical protein
MIKKQLYIIPETEVLEVRFEENIMSNPNGYHQAGGGRYYGDDLNENGDYE